VSALLEAFRWQDALDIVLVAFVLYRVLVMFRGTRTAQMLVGLAALLGASVVAHRLQLHTIQWLLDAFWSLWAVALLVLFQPELRRTLARVGQGWFFRGLLGSSGEEGERAVDAVVAAATALAARRIGALIVIERSSALRQYAELGVALDALVSSDLLESLFLPSSPLHDGAALIQGERVVAAGCFLPISRNPELARALGTRHRAGLGVSEESDAVAVVVSEETGRIGLAVDGHMETALDAAGLRERLRQLTGVERGASVPATFWQGVRRRLAPGAHRAA
jgi:diadenylate cyclase